MGSIDQYSLILWTFSHEYESISVKLTSLTVGVFEKVSLEYTFHHFLPFSLLSKSLNDFKWFAMTGKTCFGSTTLKSAQNFRPEKKKNIVEGEWVVNCGSCGALWLLPSSPDIKQSGFWSPGWRNCAVFWGMTLYSRSASLSTQAYKIKWVLANLMLGVTLWWTSIPSRGE